jgi:hypothetical protein
MFWTVCYDLAMERANAHYDDAVGTAAADWHDPAKLHELAAALGVDTSRYFPVGVKLFGTELRITTIYAIDTAPIGSNTFDSVNAYLRDNPDVSGIAFQVDADGLGPTSAFIKNFEVVLGSKGMDAIEDIEFVAP